LSDFTIEIFDTKNIVEIETTVGNILNNLEIETSSDRSVEVVSGSTVGFISVSDILGLDDYLSSFIDSYEIDCGSP
jgi:hypothetical protein